MGDLQWWLWRHDNEICRHLGNGISTLRHWVWRLRHRGE